jgi:hypothetical protein
MLSSIFPQYCVRIRCRPLVPLIEGILGQIAIGRIMVKLNRTYPMSTAEMPLCASMKIGAKGWHGRDTRG